MDEFSTEDEQVEEIRKWWSENWKQVIGGLAVGIALIFGYRGWIDAQRIKAERASAQYEILQDAVTAGDLAAATAVLTVLASDYEATPYLAQAQLATARLKASGGDLTGAAQMLESALETDDEQLEHVARLRLARIRLEQGELEEALTLTEGSTDSSFAALFADLRGDVHAAAGRKQDARVAYEEALAGDSDRPVNRELVEMKLAMLAASSGEDG